MWPVGRSTNSTNQSSSKKQEEQISFFHSPSLRDLNSGELVEIISPGSFELETVMLDSAYYNFRGHEYRFLLSKARELGLKIE